MPKCRGGILSFFLEDAIGGHTNKSLGLNWGIKLGQAIRQAK